MEKEFLKPKVHFISGKGGVGKSLSAVALAHFFSEQGYETLIIELCEEESEEFDRIPVMRHVKEKLSFLKIYPDQALFEYLSLKMPDSLLEKLFSKRLFRSLSSAMPGLFDLTRLGKIWFHADAVNKDKALIFDKIVVDLPSSGFVHRFLSIARVVKEVVKVGPLAKEAEKMDDYFRKNQNAILHLVALPEELVINESVELYQELKKAKDINVGVLFMNRVFPFLEKDLEALTTLIQNAPETKGVRDFFLSRVGEQQHQIARLKELGLAMPQITIDEQFGEHLDSQIVAKMVQAIKDSFVHE